MAKEKVVHVDFQFKRQLAEKVEGNLASFCYQCGETLIERWGFQVSANRVKNGLCSHCGAVIHGVGI